VEQLTKLFNHINFRVVSNSTIQFAKLSHLENQIFRDLFKLCSDELERLEVPLVSILFQKLHILL